MRNLLRTAAIVAGSAALVLATASPASAVEGSVYSKALTPGGSGGGGSIKAYIVFSGADKTKVYYDNMFINDVCDSNGNGDGNYAGGRAVVKFTDGSMWYGPLRLDTRSCGHAALDLGDLQFDGSKAVDNAGVQGIVMNGTSETSILSRGPIDWRDNPFTTPN